MQLSDGVLQQVIESMDVPGKAHGDAAPADPRRRERRVGVSERITLIPLTDGMPAVPFSVLLRDLSAGGIGFLHTDRIGLDQQFVALLPDGADALAVMCRVAYYQPLGERSFAIGAEFVRVLRQSASADDAGPTLPILAQTPAPATSRRVAS
jgi:hypothetical protein